MLELRAIDRCDRCGAQAYHKVTKAGQPSELLFCNHHYSEHRDVLLSGYWIVESDVSPTSPVPASAFTE